MNRLDQDPGMFWIDLRMYAMPKIEDMTASLAIAGKHLCHLFANPFR
jgi:hypothetical protein